MTVTSSTLTRASAVALALAGFLFILIQPLHPHEDIASITTNAWVVVHVLSLSMAVLGLAGITGLYLAQASRSGILGLADGQRNGNGIALGQTSAPGKGDEGKMGHDP